MHPELVMSLAMSKGPRINEDCLAQGHTTENLSEARLEPPTNLLIVIRKAYPLDHWVLAPRRKWSFVALRRKWLFVPLRRNWSFVPPRRKCSFVGPRRNWSFVALHPK